MTTLLLTDIVGIVRGGDAVTDIRAGGGRRLDGAAGPSTDYSYSYSGSYSYIHADPTTSSPTYGYNEALKHYFGLRAGTKDGVLEIVAGGYRVAVPLGAGSDWHHYCLTYDGPSRGGKGNLTLYFDGQTAWQRSRVVLDTGDANALRFGADAAGAATLAGAVDEIYVYSTALTAPQIGLLFDDITWPPTAVPSSVPTVPPSPAPSQLPSPAPSSLPSLVPTISPAPTTHEYEYDLVAYYPMTHGKLDDAHTSGYHGKAWRPDQPDVPNSMMVAAELRQTEARDGPAGDAVALNNSKYIELPKNVTKHISGDRPRTICLWARIDKWRTTPGSSSTAERRPRESCSACAPGTPRARSRSSSSTRRGRTPTSRSTSRTPTALSRRGRRPRTDGGSPTTAAIRTAPRGLVGAWRAPPTAAATAISYPLQLRELSTRSPPHVRQRQRLSAMASALGEDVAPLLRHVPKEGRPT